MRYLLDKGLNKLISKKLLVFIIATVFFTIGSLDADQWFLITMLYIGGVTVLDIVLNVRKKDASGE